MPYIASHLKDFGPVSCNYAIRTIAAYGMQTPPLTAPVGRRSNAHSCQGLPSPRPNQFLVGNGDHVVSSAEVSPPPTTTRASRHHRQLLCSPIAIPLRDTLRTVQVVHPPHPTSRSKEIPLSAMLRLQLLALKERVGRSPYVYPKTGTPIRISRRRPRRPAGGPASQA